MKTPEERVLLWVDDDGPERFLYEEYILQQSGWVVRWAKSVAQAMKELQVDCFSAVLLDQMLPFESDVQNSADVWSGCLLLYWLRGLGLPASVPPVSASHIRAYSTLTPRTENRSMQAIIVSAFHDDKVEQAIAAVRKAVPLLSKPIEAGILLHMLEEETR